MKASGLTKLYDRFTPDERVRLAIRALARSDDAEADRLARACPRKTYTMIDAGFTDRLEATEVLTLCIMVELLPRLARLRTVGTRQRLHAQPKALVERQLIVEP